jgi:glycosyltransferase involved in cell wall biosynthesis
VNILHVCKKYPKALGGDAVVVANLRRQQQTAGHKVAIVTSNCDEIAASTHVYKVGLKDTPANLDTITIKRLVSLVVLFFRMFRIVSRERPDVIHTHSIDMAFFASFAARFYHVPIVHTFHIVTFYDDSQSVLRRKTELWFARMAHLHYVTAPNSYDVKQLQEAGLSQAVLLPNGVDLEFWKPEERHNPEREFVFLTIGRLECQKGCEYLIRAAALLVASGAAPFRIVIIGEGSQEQLLRGLTHSQQMDSVILFTGRKSKEEVRALLAQSDAAVFPSLYETTPITLLEAWASGVPTIVSSVGIVRDTPANFNAAYVVPPQDEQALMRAMEQCMVDATFRSVIGNNGKQEAQKYDWPIIMQTAEMIYRSTQ